MTEEEKKRRGEELKRRRQAENKAKGAHKTSARPDAPRATTGQEDTNAALEAETQGGKLPKSAGAPKTAGSTGTSAKATGIAANGEKETQTTEPYGPQPPEGLRHDPEMDGQFVDSFIQARLRGPQAFAAWVDTLPLPGSGAKETAAAPLFAQTNGGDVQPVENVDGQGDGAQEPDEVGLVEAALDRAEGANAEAETEENGPTPALTEELTEEPMPQPTPGPTEEPRPQPMPGPTPGPTPEPEQGTQTESTEEPTPELAAEQPLEESATLQQATPALEDGVSAAEQETEPDGAAEEIDLWSANTDYVAGIDTQLKEIRERIAAIDGELAEGPNEALSAEREQLVESQKQLRSDRARGVGKWTVAEELVQSIQEQWETLQAQFDAGDYRAFIEDEELWDAVKDDPESAKYAAQTELGRQQKELNLQSTVVLAHQPHDDETRFYRSTADSNWLKMLYDREIALQSGDTARVQEINAAMDAAGFEKKWPEEVAAEKRLQEEMIAYAYKRGDEAVRKKLNLGSDEEVTDAHRLQYAQTDVGVLNWIIFHPIKSMQQNMEYLSGEEGISFWEYFKRSFTDDELKKAQFNDRYHFVSYDPDSEDSYDEQFFQAMAERRIVGDEGSYAEMEAGADIAALPSAAGSGMVRPRVDVVGSTVRFIADTYYQFNKDQMGGTCSKEQMRVDDWFYNLLCTTEEIADKASDMLDVDVSQRSGWVQDVENISYSVAQNYRFSKIAGFVGGLLANFAHTVPQAQKVFTLGRKFVETIEFWVSGYKSGAMSIAAAGGDDDQQYMGGILHAGVEAFTEHLDDLGALIAPYGGTKGIDEAVEAMGGWEKIETVFKAFIGEGSEEVIGSPLHRLVDKGLVDPDMPWTGEGGVIDVEDMWEGGKVGGISGMILALMSVCGTGNEHSARTSEEAKPKTAGDTAESWMPAGSKQRAVAEAISVLESEDASEKTRKNAEKILDTIADGQEVPEYMMKALEDARAEDIAAKAAGGKAAKSREELGKAQDGLKEKIGKRSIAEANVQKQEQWLLRMKKALKENPTPENLKAYQKAQADHRAAQQQLERAQQEVIAQQRAVNGWKEQADADYKTSQQDKVKLKESIRGVQDGIAALPQEQQAGLRELWQKNVEALGIDEGTAATLEAVQEARKAAAEVEAEKTESQNISEETGDLQETTDANGDIMEENKSENTFADPAEMGEETSDAPGDLLENGTGIAENKIGEAEEHTGENAVFKTELDYITSTGLKLKAEPGKTTTILGAFKVDTESILKELGNVKTLDFGPREGGFNLLNTPDELYKTPEQFWNEYNKPWLDQVIERGDPIYLATEPEYDVLYWLDTTTGEEKMKGFGREYTYLIENGYYYDKTSKRMIKGEE